MLLLFFLLCITVNLSTTKPQQGEASPDLMSPSAILPTTLRGEAEVTREDTNPDIELSHDLPASDIQDEDHPFGESSIVTFKDSPMDRSILTDFGYVEKDGSFNHVSPDIANMIAQSESYNGAEPLTPSKLKQHKALDYTHFNNETFI